MQKIVWSSVLCVGEPSCFETKKGKQQRLQKHCFKKQCCFFLRFQNQFRLKFIDTFLYLRDQLSNLHLKKVFVIDLMHPIVIKKPKTKVKTMSCDFFFCVSLRKQSHVACLPMSLYKKIECFAANFALFFHSFIYSLTHLLKSFFIFYYFFFHNWHISNLGLRRSFRQFQPNQIQILRI